MPRRIQPPKSSAGRALALLAMLCVPAAFEAATGYDSDKEVTAHGEIGTGRIDVPKAGK